MTSNEGSLRFDRTAKNGPATMTVRATDKAGNITERTFRVVVDNQAPVVTVNLADGADVRGPFTVKATSLRDSTGPAHMDGYDGDLASYTPRRAAPWALPFHPSGNDGWKSVKLNFIDKAGNRTQLRRRVYFDTDKPAVRFSNAPKTGSKLTTSVHLTAEAADNRAVAKVQLLVDGKVVATDRRVAYRFLLNPKKYGKKFTVRLRAYDRAGNVAYSTTRTYRG